MGWTGMYDKPQSIPRYFEEQWTAPRDDGSRLRCLGQAFVGRFTLYGVWQHTSADGAPLAPAFATVTLIQYNNNATDRCAWYYKDMDETVGPCEAKCPKSLLKLLGPTDQPYAIAWRKACWDNAKRTEWTRSRAQLKRRIDKMFNSGTPRAEIQSTVDAWMASHPQPTGGK